MQSNTSVFRQKAVRCKHWIDTSPRQLSKIKFLQNQTRTPFLGGRPSGNSTWVSSREPTGLAARSDPLEGLYISAASSNQTKLSHKSRNAWEKSKLKRAILGRFLCKRSTRER